MSKIASRTILARWMQLFYPTSHADAKSWLKHFLKHRLADFGAYEDAIVQGESWLWHSVLTPSLNTGLLTPIKSSKADVEIREAKTKYH